MFDFVREKKIVVQVILAAVIVPFALWGVDSYQKSTNTGGLATVGDFKVTQQEFDLAFKQQTESMREQMGEAFDPKMFDTPEAKQAILDGLIAQKVLLGQAKAMGVTITDTQVADVIQGIEAFQVNGKFDSARYESALASQNMNKLGFEARLREDLLGQQVRTAYAQNGFASLSVLENIVKANDRLWTVSAAEVSATDFMANVKLDEAEIKKYYDQNQKAFQTPEQVKVEYVKLARQDLMTGIAVSDADIEQYYKDHQGDFGTPEQRQASHILITLAPTASPAEQDAAKKKAESLLEQVKKEPAKFAELAKQNSQDPGSAVNGGDLGMFGPGMMVKPFEQAVYALKQDEISGLVKSDFGYHIIKLTGIKAGSIAPLAEAKPSIVDKIRQQKATDIYMERADKFNDAAYTQSDSLKSAAEVSGGKVEQSDWLTKGMPSNNEVFNAKMTQAIFTDDVIKNKRNTTAVEVGDHMLVAARVLEHKPASVRPLAEVQEGIRSLLKQQQAEKMAATKGAEYLAKLQKGEATDLKWSEKQEVTRGQRGGKIDVEAIRKVFQVDRSKLPAYIGAEVKGKGYTLVRVESTKEAEKVDEAKRNSYAQQLRQLTGTELLMAYLADAKQKSKIEVNMPTTKSQ